MVRTMQCMPEYPVHGRPRVRTMQCMPEYPVHRMQCLIRFHYFIFVLLIGQSEVTNLSCQSPSHALPHTKLQLTYLPIQIIMTWAFRLPFLGYREFWFICYCHSTENMTVRRCGVHFCFPCNSRFIIINQ